MTETATTHDTGADDHGHATPHMPPPSFAPINAALALAITLTGFLGDIRDVVGPVMWVGGLIYLIASGYFWARGARNEYLELPEDGGH
jgi:hypothetical protein